MNRAEAATLLTLMAAGDKRTLGDADVLFWAEQLSDINLADARTAVMEHYRTSNDFLMPKHVRDGVARIRKARLVNVAQLEPAADPDDPRAFAAELAAVRREVADGVRDVPPLPPARELPGLRRGLASLGSGIAEVRAALSPQGTA